MDILAKLSPGPAHSPKQPPSTEARPKRARQELLREGYRPCAPEAELRGRVVDRLDYSESGLLLLEGQPPLWAHLFKGPAQPRLGDTLVFHSGRELGLRHGLPYLHLEGGSYYIIRQ
jgi:hypothetical protein